MISIIEGKTGTGKTAFMTALGYWDADDGRKIYSNYHLKFPYTYLKSLGSFSDWPKEPCSIMMDEAHSAGLDSRGAMREINKRFTKNITQHRKIQSNMYLTAQDTMMIDVRCRDICHMFMRPEIAVSDPETGKPLILKVFWTDNAYDICYSGLKRWKGAFHFPIVYGDIDICEMYDTSEIIEEMESPEKDERMEVIKKYMPMKELQKKDLVAKMVIEDGVSKTNALVIADYVKMGCA